MKNRTLLILLVILLGGGYWFLYGRPGVGQSGLELAGHQTRSNGARPADLPAARVPAVGAARETRTDQAAPDPQAFEPGDYVEQLGARRDGSVVMEVQVVLSEELSPGQTTRPPFSDITVHAQSWDESSDQTSAHQAQTDAQGIAHFLFPGELHIDWVKAEVPPGPGRLVAIAAPHEDIQAGSVFRISLLAVPGVHIVGRVIDASGQPLANIPVSAYFEGGVIMSDKAPEDQWYPPTNQVFTRSDGLFEFPAVSEDVEIGVAPGEWLQVDSEEPQSPQEQDGTRTDLDWLRGFSEADRLQFVETITLVKRAEVQLLVLDRSGQPATGAVLHIEPDRLSVPGFMGWEQRERLEERAATELEREQIRKKPCWNRQVTLETDESGRCTFFGVAGNWRCVVTTRVGDPLQQLELKLVAPQATQQIIRLPWAVTTVSGSVVDAESGAPVPGARVRFSTDKDRTLARTDDSGAFEIAGVGVERPYGLHATHRHYFPSDLVVPAGQTQSQIELHKASELQLSIVDSEGMPITGKRIRLLRRVEDGDAPPLSDLGRAWLEQQRYPIGRSWTDGSGGVNFDQLYPGRYELELLLPTEKTERGMWGEALAEDRVWGSWTVSVRGASTPLVANLQGYEGWSPPVTIRFKGKVTEVVTGKVIDWGRISVTMGGYTNRFSIRSGGHYSFRLPQGEFQYELAASDYLPVFGRANTSENRLNFQLQPERGE
ncbi:MAG TPA: carboxypeptidase regulatory-like domain-containing protein [Gemmatimonadetes bacterium]|nr:carboxypeptidase regulatory-like domain-containing protein [Gemmatimonadota bacterium]